MKRTKLKTGRISDFFSSRKSQKASSSSSPHDNEPEVEIIDQIPQFQEHSIPQETPFIPPQDIPEEQARASGSNASVDEEYIYDIDLLPLDPGKIIPISAYSANDRDAVRRGFIGKGACQPHNHNFPRTEFGTQLAPCKRKFVVGWYAKYPWLEYSIEKDAAFCFVCYLFKDETTDLGKFVIDGFRGWNKAHERFVRHFGPTFDSAHKEAQGKFDNFINPRTSIVEKMNKTSKEASVLYKRRLTHSVDCLRFLLRQGLAFCGHDESETSTNRGNFIELLKWLAGKDENVNAIVLKNAPSHSKLICSDIQKDIIHACAEETTKLVLEELGDNYFGILADESSDVSHKEQLAICLRFVDKDGILCERFLGVVKVGDTSSLLLKKAITEMIEGNKLSMSKIRGQGYDGASNMRGGINGLKTLIMNDTPSAHYIYCFAHQLQLTLVAVARDNYDCKWFFEQISYLLNLIGVSCKRQEMLRVVQARKLLENLDLGIIQSGQGLNQEVGLARPGDTRWGSYYKTISNVMALYPSIFEVLLIIGKTGHRDDRLKAQTVMVSFESFQFVFMAHLMLLIFGYTQQLCQALQRRDQDIVNAMTFVRLTKSKLSAIRNDGWEEFIGKVSSVVTIGYPL